MKIRSILNRFHRKPGPLNILTIPTDEMFNIYLGELPHNFWYYYPDDKEWNKKFGAIPKNFHKLEKFSNKLGIPSWLDLDLILCQHAPFHKQLLEQYAILLNIPIIETNIYQNNCVNLDIFKNLEIERQTFALIINDDWAKKAKTHGYYIWEKLKSHIPTVIFGNNIGISREITCVDEAVHIYNQASLFLNLTLINEEHNLRMIEAMACGCPIVSVKTQIAEKIIQNGENGFISDNIGDLIQNCKNILSNKTIFSVFSESSQKKAQQYNYKNIIKNLSDGINKVYEEYII